MSRIAPSIAPKTQLSFSSSIGKSERRTCSEGVLLGAF